jgi:hypothetical protein
MSDHLSENLFEQDTQTPVLLPEQTDPLVPDDAFTRYEESLDDRPDATDLIVAPEEPPPLGRGWAYDFVNHQFVQSPGQHGPLATHGTGTLSVWIEKCLRTARGELPIYSDGFGLDSPADFFGMNAALFPTDLFAERVRDALTQHPRIADVTDLAVQFDDTEEYVAVSFTVVTGEGDLLQFTNVKVEA